MGLAETFAALAAWPEDHRLAFALAAADEADEAAQIAGVGCLAGELGRPELVVDRYADLLPGARRAVQAAPATFLPVARAKVQAGNDPARHGAYRLLGDLGGDEDVELLVRGLDDESARVRDGVLAALERHLREVQRLVEREDLERLPSGSLCPAARSAAAVSALAAVLRKYASHRQEAFAAILTDLGEAALPVVHSTVLGAGDVELRQAMVQALSERTSRGGVALLFAMARDRSPAAQAIARDLFDKRRDAAFGLAVAEHLAGAVERSLPAAQKLVRETPWLTIVEPVLEQLAPSAAAGVMQLLAVAGLDDARLQQSLSRFLLSADAPTRRRALDLLRERGLRPPTEAMTTALQDDDEEVQLAAAQTIIALDVPDKMALLTPLLGAAAETVRRVAMTEISKVSFERYMLRFERMDARARQIAARALAKIDASMIERLADEIGSLDARRRLKALHIVDLLDAEEQLREPLLELLEDPDERVRATAVRIVALTGCMEGMRLLVAALADPDRRVRANAIETFEQLQDRRFVGMLAPFLRDPDNRVRANAAKALWNLGWIEARDELLEMLKDQDETMRISAVWAIAAIPFADARELLEAREIAELSGKVRLKIRDTLAKLAAQKEAAP